MNKEEIEWMVGHFENYLMGIQSANKKFPGKKIDALTKERQDMELKNTVFMIARLKGILEQRKEAGID